MHTFDRHLFARTALAGVLLTLLAFGIVALTDEPLSTLGMRVARMSAIVPALAALAVAVVLAQAEARGELAALAALGAGPLARARGAIAGGWLLGVAATALVLSPLSDASALFPRVPVPAEWTYWQGALSAPGHGVRVLADGSLTLGEAAAERALPPAPGRAAAALAVGPLALAAPAWAASPVAWRWRLAVLLLSLALVVLLLHAVAAERVPALLLVVSALPLALQAVLGRAKTRTC